MSSIKDIWAYANNIINSARQMVNEELEPLQLSSSEGNVLLHLLTVGEILCQEDLVEQLEISKPAVSRALNSLERKGFVVRKKDPKDRRMSRVYLTAKAERIGPQVEAIYEKVFGFAAQGVSKEEVSNFIAVFKRISESFSAAREEKKERKV